MRSVRREAAHGLLQAFSLECAGAQGLDRLGHAAEKLHQGLYRPDGTAASKSWRLRRLHIAAVRIFIGRANRRLHIEVTAKAPKQLSRR